MSRFPEVFQPLCCDGELEEPLCGLENTNVIFPYPVFLEELKYFIDFNSTYDIVFIFKIFY